MQQKFTFKKFKGSPVKLIALMAAMVLSFCAKAQITAGSYSFTQSSGTYTPITGGTLISSTIPDYQAFPAITLTPGFNFCGTVYTSAYVTADGLITLGGATAANTTNGIANGGGSGILLCPFNADMIGSSASGATPNIRYQLVGNEHVFQWNDISRYPSSTDRFSFQARLNTVTGTITYVYSVTSVGTSLNYQPVIGIRTDNTTGNWQSRTVGTGPETWATSLPGTTTSSTLRFTNASPAKMPTTGQTYVYNPPPPCNTSSSLPTAGTTAVSPGTVCVSSNVTLTVTPGSAVPAVTGLTYKWQSSPNGTTWTDIAGAITTLPTYTTTTPISTPLYFRGVMLCNGTTTVFNASATPQLVVNNPGSPTVTPGTRCGPGTVTLAATPPAGSTLKWYNTPTGGLPLSTTSPFTTPFIPATTTFYVAAASGASPANPQIGTANTILPNYTSGGPFSNYYRAEQAQYLYTAAELIAAGGGAGTINSLSFNCTEQPMYSGSSNLTTLPNYKICIITVPASTTTLTWQPAANFGTPVYTNATFMPAMGWNTFTFSTPFAYNGVDNIIVRICYDQTSPTYSSGGPSFTAQGKHEYTAATGRVMYFASDGVPTACDQTGTSTSTYLPNARFGMTLGCEGARVPVVATVTAPPALTKTFPAIVCNNAVGTFQVTSPVGQYSNYAWTPATELYTNAAGTVPYVAGSNAPTIYFKSNVVGARQYSLYATNTTAPNCAFADTVRTWVQPDSVYIKALPDTICISGSTYMTLVPGSGYAANGLQWQSSADGINYTDIAGQTSPVYATPVLTSNTYYRVLIKSAGSTPCLMPVKYIVVANPSLVSYADSFNCGPGSVTLSATSGGNAGLKWYDSPTGTTPVGAGSPFVTPYLGATTTYYLAASSGSPQPAPTIIGTGTSGTSGPYLPYYRSYYGVKVQWLITAAEMQAAGFSAGLITSLGFNVTSAGGAVQNMILSLKNTTATTLVAPFNTNMQQVYTSASYTPTNGMNVHTFQVPFEWDGTSNIIVEECHNNTNTGTSSSVTYLYSYPTLSCLYNYANVANHCTTPGGTTYSSNYRPNMRIAMLGACESNRVPVVANIFPMPLVDLGPDINKCVDAGAVEVLDAGYQPNTPQYLWDNGSVSQVRAINQSGTYNVKVTNQYTCVGSDTVVVVLRNNPVVHLGNDTTVCNGVVLPLNAGNQGIDYFWNTGETSQIINVNAAGTYNVFVTNNQGCVKADTIVVNMQGELPSIQGIQVSNNGQYTFHYTAINPQNVIGYEWDFGDSSAHSYQVSPYHTYVNAGNYIVILHLSSSCGFFSDSSSAHIVGIHQLNVSNDELTVFPNPTRATATIMNKGDLKMEKVQVYNVLGQVVYEAKADSKEKHTLDLGGFASGVYTIEVFTDKGTVPRKLEILK